jgi:N utilization substance protein A
MTAPQGAPPGGLDSALAAIWEELGVDPTRLMEEVSLALSEALTEAGSPVAGQVGVRLAPWGGVEVVSIDEGEQVPISLAPQVVARAARLARIRLARQLEETRRDRLAAEALEHRGQLMDGVVERRAGATWFLRAGHLQAVLGPTEQIPGERLSLGRHLKVVLLESRRGGPEMIEVRASRTSPLLLRRLLEIEVPEVASGEVVIRAVTREPGVRAKVAVESLRPGLDPKGACIGPKSTRIRSVVGELAGEEVDIVEWADDAATFVARALAPAAVLGVRLDEDGHRAVVEVAPELLSLAIGKEGRNARLAARLTGWRIDIRVPDTAP